MQPVSLIVNGEKVDSHAEPRTHLGDFLREDQRLTGTLLGCEHGICGACTVLIDGVPSRSCIAYTVACEGREVRTIEGFGDDAVMAQLHRLNKVVLSALQAVRRIETLRLLDLLSSEDGKLVDVVLNISWRLRGSALDGLEESLAYLAV
jgi:hypothetical protein